jgi:hypothetical protein
MKTGRLPHGKDADEMYRRISSRSKDKLMELASKIVDSFSKIMPIFEYYVPVLEASESFNDAVKTMIKFPMR